MAKQVEQTDTKDTARLQKIPDSHTQGPDREDNGRAYGDFLMRLQIKPGSHESFFHSNLKPFRNRDARLKLLAKGDAESLQQLSEMYLTALGKIVWAKERGWLLSEGDLPPAEEPLWYILPKDRKPGDHDRFYAILAPLWECMRNNIFEVKPAAPRKRRPVQAIKPAKRARKRVPRGDKPSSIHSRAALSPETASPQQWSQERLEDAIQDIITTMEEARRNSHPDMFSRIWQAQMARLIEYEQYEKQEAEIQSSIHGGLSLQNGDQSDAPSSISPDATDDEGATVVDEVTDAEISINSGFVDELQADHSTSSPHKSIPPTGSMRTSHSRDGHLHPHIQQPPPPSVSIATTPTHLAPSLPQVLSAYITPFSTLPSASPPTNPNSSQPYLWPDAPCHTTSYPAFKRGIRVRAGVPDQISDEKLGFVIAYGWNESCRAVMGEGDWEHGVVEDLRQAARKGVTVWRIRVCCVAK